jgi:hydrogenase maturation protease
MGDFVLGIGNVLLRDEGIGCHVVHALEKVSLPNVEIIDGGTCPDVVQLLEDVDRLIIVDAAVGGGTPGQIYRFNLEDITLEEKPFLSLHDMGIVDSIISLKLSHRIGETIIIGVEPKEMGWGLELSPELKEKMSQIVEIVLAELDNTTNGKGEVKC